MEVIQTKLKGVLLLKPQLFGDQRGWFTESWSRRKLEEAGLFYDFVQDNHSYNEKKGTLRGLHFQKGAASQAKLIRCVRGSILDVAVDLRIGSPTYLSWVAVTLSKDNQEQLLIPRGFAHGFLTLTDDVEVLYKADNYYQPEADCHIRWNDETIGISWGIEAPILSEADANGLSVKQLAPDFHYQPRILVTGAGGQLGQDITAYLKKMGSDYYGIDLSHTGDRIYSLDITKQDAVESFMNGCQPDAVLHCAAYTAVDAAEEQQQLCHRVNVTGTANLARTCKALDCKFLYVSTEYIFSGNEEGEYEVDAAPAPRSVYGRTKWEGEEAVKELLSKYFIVRISWAFGLHGKNFVDTMLRLGKTHKEISVVNDQVGSPTYTKDVAPLLCDIIMTDAYGTYHATNEGYCSWADFARKIFELSGMDTKVKSITSEQYGAKAMRPKNSVLSKKSLTIHGFHRLPSWEDALARYLTEKGLQ